MDSRQDSVTFWVISHPVPEIYQRQVSCCLPEHSDHVCQESFVPLN